MSRFNVEQMLCGDKYTIELDGSDLILLYSILEYVSLYDFEGGITEEEIWLVTDLLKDMKYYINERDYKYIKLKV